jgi:hypothetical protein
MPPNKFSYRVAVVNTTLERDRQEKIVSYFRQAVVAGWTDYFLQPIVRIKFLIINRFIGKLGDNFTCDLNTSEGDRTIVAMVMRDHSLVVTLQATMVDLDLVEGEQRSLQSQAAETVAGRLGLAMQDGSGKVRRGLGELRRQGLPGVLRRLVEDYVWAIWDVNEDNWLSEYSSEDNSEGSEDSEEDYVSEGEDDGENSENEEDGE